MIALHLDLLAGFERKLLFISCSGNWQLPISEVVWVAHDGNAFAW